MTWRRPQDSFERAKTRELYRRFTRLVRGRQRADLLELDEVRARLRLFDQSYAGVMPIRVDQIVGTAGKSEEFGADFLPRREEIQDRWRGLERAFPEGEFPPITVYQVGEAYFVIDGHHRVAIAKQTEVEFIDAEVTVLHTRFDIPKGVDIPQLIMAEQERMFLDESGLGRARPEARIEFSRPVGYIELLELVKVHGYHLMQEAGAVKSPEEIARHWYDHVYMPAVDSIKHEQLDVACPGCTQGDLFLSVWERRRALYPERGGMTLDEAIRVAKEERRRTRSVRRAGDTVKRKLAK